MEDDRLFEYFLRPVRGFESHENILDFMLDRGDYPFSGLYDTARPHLYDRKDKSALFTDVTSSGNFDTLNMIRNLGLPYGDHHRCTFPRCCYGASRRQSYYPISAAWSRMTWWRVKKPRPSEPFIVALDMLRTTTDDSAAGGDSRGVISNPQKNLASEPCMPGNGDRFSDDRSSVQADYTLNYHGGITGNTLRACWN